MVVHLAALSAEDSAAPGNRRLADVLVEQLARLEPEPLHLPLPRPPAPARDRRRAGGAADDRATLADWGRRVAMSERTLARLVRQEVGMSFGRWRQRACTSSWRCNGCRRACPCNAAPTSWAMNR